MRRCLALAVLVSGFLAAATLTAQVPPAAPPLALPLEPAPGGHIVFTRGVPITAQAGGLRATIPVPKLFVMNADGSGVKPFFATPDFTTASEPQWCAGYGALTFSSDWQQERSCCVQDIFFATADGRGHWRITGNELRGPAPKGYGAVTGVLRDNTKGGEWHLEKPSVGIHITAQGADGLVVHPGEAQDVDMVDPDTREKWGKERWRRFYLPKVAAGDKVWIKVWSSKHMGNLLFAGVKANTVNDIGEIELNIGNYYAGAAAITPDGKYAIGMGGIASVDTRAKTPIAGVDDAPIGSNMPVPGGAQALCVYDVATGVLLYSWDASRMGFNGARDPALSPDGRFVAMACGQFSLEGLALVEFESLRKGAPSPRVLVAGERILPSAATMGKTGNVSCGSPAWSPDGRTIAFTRVWLGEIVAGNLWLVGADGSGLRQLTNFGPDTLCTQPCFSPDGAALAFTLIRGKQGYIAPEQLLASNVNMNICRLDLATGQVTALTNDNASADPAWGR